MVLEHDKRTRTRTAWVATLCLACALPSWARGAGPCSDPDVAVARPDGVDAGTWGATDDLGAPSAVTVQVLAGSVPLVTLAGDAVQPVSAGGTPVDVSSLWCSNQSVTFTAQATSAAGLTSATSRAYIFGQVSQPPPPPPPAAGEISLSIVGDPATGDWGVRASLADPRTVTLQVNLDGQPHHTEMYAPYGFPDDDKVGTFGAGDHTIEFIFTEVGTGVEVARKSITVTEGSATPPPPPPPQAVCGNGQLEVGEACDGTAGCNGACSSDCLTCVPCPTCPTCPEEPPQPNFECDGRTKCSQMTSCEEAIFFLNECGMKRMDFDKDGIPCEGGPCSGG